MRRLVALVAGAGVVLAGAAAVPTAQGAVPVSHAASASRAAGFNPGNVDWHKCPKGTFLRQYGAQCGSLRVPLDYAHPGGRKITLALS
ncbi:MAG: alpha/beta hydrolase, partial [Nocardioidaceae bacterium]